MQLVLECQSSRSDRSYPQTQIWMRLDLPHPGPLITREILTGTTDPQESSKTVVFVCFVIVPAKPYCFIGFLGDTHVVALAHEAPQTTRRPCGSREVAKSPARPAARTRDKLQ